MTKRKRKSFKHFICRWCDQDVEPPVRAHPRVGKRTVMVCPGCRGPV